MKSHADAPAELAKDFPRVAEIAKPTTVCDCHSCEVRRYLLTLAATLNAQRKQLESRVEKLEGDKDLLITAVTAMKDCDCGNHVFDCDNPPAASDHHETWCNYRVGTSAIKAALDALAKEQPRE